MSTVIERCVYSDVNYTEITPGTPPLITNKDAIFYSLHNLFTTVVGERLNEVTYGVDLPKYLFEQIDTKTANELRYSFINAVRRWEPRVEIDLAKTTVTPLPDDNSYKLNLVFNLVGLNESSIIISGLYKKQFAKDKENTEI